MLLILTWSTPYHTYTCVVEETNANMEVWQKGTSENRPCGFRKQPGIDQNIKSTHSSQDTSVSWSVVDCIAVLSDGCFCFILYHFQWICWCILGRGVFLSFWHEAFVYLEVVALLGVARRFLFRYSPTIPPPCHTHSPVFLYLGNPYSCISVFVNALNSCFPLCEAKFDRLLVHSGICPPTQNSISLQFLVHSPLSACCSSFRAWCPNSKVHNNFHTRSGRPENCLCELKPPWKL